MDMSENFVQQTRGALAVASDRAREIISPAAMSEETAEAKETSTRQKPKAPVTFSHFFDEAVGNVHLQALELLSTECTMRVQEAQRKCEAQYLPELLAFLQMIPDRFEEDPADDMDDTISLVSD